MKELNIEDYQLVTGGLPPLVVAAAQGAAVGLATYAGSQAMGEQAPTWTGALASMAGGAIAGPIGARIGTLTGSVIAGAASGATEGIVHSIYEDISNSQNNSTNQSGSDYNSSGCNYC